MAPVVKTLAAIPGLHSSVCVTAQHRDMLDQVLSLFDIRPDFDLDIMKPGQTLPDVMSAVLQGMDGVLAASRPDLVLVHGDTSTTFAASLSAYYRRIPVGHVEAGLRTGNMYAPWPEEANRKLTGTLAALHFAPTEEARRNLLREGVAPDAIHVTGNTVIDALLEVSQRFDNDLTLNETMQQRFPFLGRQRMVLITAHRRENFGDGFEQICAAIRLLAEEFPDTAFIYPVHPNPNVREPVNRFLSGLNNIHLIEPQDYLPFVWLMKRAQIILTDSGGIQEEAPSLGKPVLVMRETTERPEAVGAGVVALVGSDTQRIATAVRHLLDDPAARADIAAIRNPFGDGKAAARIAAAICGYFE